MGKILIEANTKDETVKMMAEKCSNMDFCAVITSVVRNAADQKMITDMDVLMLADIFLEKIMPKCEIKLLDEKEKKPHKESEIFTNFPDFGELLKGVFGDE